MRLKKIEIIIRENQRETKKKNTPLEIKNKTLHKKLERIKNTHTLGSEFIRFLCYLKKDK